MRSTRSPRSVRWQQESRSPEGSRVLKDARLKAGGSVYHYLEYPHALSIFSDERLRLANPLAWPDPYDQWCKSLFEPPGPLHETSAYALCWNRNPSDEAAWRMAGFQRANPIIRIRCRVPDILAAASALAAQRPGAFFAGRVSYEREEQLYKRASPAQTAQIKDASRTAANLLLAKRNAFRFENEVRILWLDREAQKTALFLPIDAKSVVKQVMCSPYAHPQQRQKIREEFAKRFDVEVSDSGISAFAS